MTPTGNRLRNHRATFALAVCAALSLASALPLTVASCRTRTAPPDEPAAYERLRLLTRGGVLPAEPQLAQLANEYKGTRTGSLAQLVRARVRHAANDYAGAAELLRTTGFKDETRVGDYALWLRGDALDKAGRRAEARAAFEALVRDYPVALKRLADADDTDALLLTAKAYEQSGDQLKALAANRRLYFYAPAYVDREAEAVAAFARLNSSAAPANAEEAAARADRLNRE